MSPKKSSRSGLAAPGREEVDDAAAHRVFAGLAHRVGAAVAVVAQKALQPVERDPPAGPQGQHPAIEQFARRHRCTSALTVVSTTSGFCSGAGASRVSVSMRRR